MKKNFEAWWVCTCGTKIHRVGKPTYSSWRDHYKICPIKIANENSSTYTSVGMHIEQVPQTKKGK